MAIDVEQEVGTEAGATKPLKIPGLGLLKGLFVTLKTMLRPAVTRQYPHVKPDLPPRTRGVIALKQENCTVCWKCSKECPDWCIYIESHKETHEPATGGRARSAKVLDRFAIDYALCMYCGICVEVCPFDALFWSPEFEYATYDIRELTHEKDQLQEWTYSVLPPPELEVGAIPAHEEAPGEAASTETPPGPAEAAAVPAPATRGVASAEPATASEGPGGPPEGTPLVPEGGPTGPSVEAPTAPAAPPAPAPRVEVEPDQEVYDRVLQEELDKGTSRRVAEGRAKAAAVRAARKKAEDAG